MDYATEFSAQLVLNISVIALLSFYLRSTHILGYWFMLYLRTVSVKTIEKIRLEKKRESEGEATFLVHKLLAPPPFWCCLA